jgi:hypothetical protein
MLAEKSGAQTMIQVRTAAPRYVYLVVALTLFVTTFSTMPFAHGGEPPKVAVFVTEWAKSATGGGTQVPTSDAAVWTLMITVKNLTAQELNNVQIQAAMYKRLPNGSIQEVGGGGNPGQWGGAMPNQQMMMNPAIAARQRAMMQRGGQFNPAQMPGAQGRFAETIYLRVGEIKQIKVEGTIGGAGAASGMRQQNFVGRGQGIGGHQPLQAAGGNQQGTEKYVGYSVVVYHNGEVIARADRNPERIPNFGIGGGVR